MASTFLGFQVLRRVAAGAITPLAETEVLVYDVTSSASLDPLETDSSGFIPTQIIDVAPGTELRFSVSGFAETLTRTTRASTELAEDDITDSTLVLFVEDLMPAPENDDAIIDIEVWLKDNDNPTNPPRLLGITTPGVPLKVAHDPEIHGTNIELYLIARSEKNYADVLGLHEAIHTTFTFSETLLTEGSETLLTESGEDLMTEGA